MAPRRGRPPPDGANRSMRTGTGAAVRATDPTIRSRLNGGREDSEVLAIVPDDHAEHQGARASDERQLTPPHPVGEQAAKDDIGKAEPDSHECAEDPDEERAPGREVTDDRSHGRLEPERIFLGEKDESHEDAPQCAADDEADHESHGTADHEISYPDAHRYFLPGTRRHEYGSPPKPAQARRPQPSDHRDRAAGYALWITRIWLPDGSRKPASTPYGCVVGSCVNSTPLSLSSS